MQIMFSYKDKKSQFQHFHEHLFSIKYIFFDLGQVRIKSKLNIFYNFQQNNLSWWHWKFLTQIDTD